MSKTKYERVVKYDQVGKRGTITNGAGQTLTGEVSSRESNTFNFLIDNNEASNRFRLDEWDFVPDRETIPTKAMAVIEVNDHQGNDVFVKTRMGWHSVSGTTYQAESIQKWADRSGFDVLFEGIA